MSSFSILIVMSVVALSSGAPQYLTSTGLSPLPAIPHAPIASYAAAPALSYAQGPIAVSHASIASYAAPALPLAQAPVAVAHAPALIARPAEEYDPHPQYSFSYAVNDPTTGDAKQQTESRDGDNVRGSYSLVEPDGSTRTVDYTADPINGFNAVVQKGPAAHAAPVALAPALGAIAPRVYSSPVAIPATTIPYAALAPLAIAPQIAGAHPQTPVQSSYASPGIPYSLG